MVGIKSRQGGQALTSGLPTIRELGDFALHYTVTEDLSLSFLV